MALEESPASDAPDFCPGTAAYAAKLHRMQHAVRALLEGIGEDVGREGLIDTPKRVAKAFLDMTAGYRQPLHRVLGDALFNEPIITKGAGGLVLVRDIDFAALSEDSLLPFHGRAHIAYVPSNGVVLGLSKLARLTSAASRQLQSPQGLAQAVVRVLQQQLDPHGVAVVVDCKRLSFSAAAPAPALHLVASGSFLQPDLQLLPELLAMLDLSEQQVQFQAAAAAAADPAAGQHGLLHPAASDTLSEQGSAGGWDAASPAPATPSHSIDLDSDRRSEEDDSCGPASSCSSGATDGMEAAMQLLLAEAGVDVAAPAAQASIRRYVLSLLAATSGYHQEHLVANGGSSSSFSSLSSQSSCFSDSPPSTALPTMGVGGVGHGRGGVARCCCACGPAHHGAAAEEGPGAAAVPGAQPAGSCLPEVVPGMSLEHHRVPFISQCEHHMLPFYGTLHVALVRPPSAPSTDGGLLAAQVAQLVGVYTQRLQVQERITQQVADALQRLLGLEHVMVAVRATHMCMVARGVENHAGSTVTRAVTGVFASDARLRAGVLRMAARHQQ